LNLQPWNDEERVQPLSQEFLLVKTQKKHKNNSDEKAESKKKLVRFFGIITQIS